METKKEERAIEFAKCNAQTMCTWAFGILSERVKGQPCDHFWASAEWELHVCDLGRHTEASGN